MKRSKRIPAEVEGLNLRLAPIVKMVTGEGVGAEFFGQRTELPNRKPIRRGGAPKIWTLERYVFIIGLRELGEKQLRKCGETRFSDYAAMEAGIRVSNRETYSPVPENEIKKKAREFTNRLAEARTAVRQSFEKQ